MTYTATDRRRVMDAAYRRRYAYLRYIGEPTNLVPAERAAEHVQRLYDLGWSTKALAEISNGVTDTTVVNLLRGRHSTIERGTEKAVLAIPYTLAPTADVLPEMLVPSLGATRRVRALMRLGWTHPEMRKRAPSTVHLVRGAERQMNADKWRRIAAMYDALSMTPGPSRITAKRAEAFGYAPPLAFDDIDDPDEQPIGMSIEGGVWAERAAVRIAALEDYADQGMTLDGACAELGITDKSLWKWCDRYDRRELYERLAARQRVVENRFTRGVA